MTEHEKSLAGGAGLRELIARWREGHSLGRVACANELEAALSALPDVGEHLRAVEQERDEYKAQVDIFRRNGGELFMLAFANGEKLRAAEAERDAALSRAQEAEQRGRDTGLREAADEIYHMPIAGSDYFARWLRARASHPEPGRPTCEVNTVKVERWQP